MTRVLIVDDDPLVRSGLSLILGGAADMEVVAQAGDGEAGVVETMRHKPDVVLMDIRMPVLDGLSATEKICAMTNAPHVIVLTTFDGDDYVLRALGAGASGFLMKDTPPADIVDAIRKVADGDPMLSPSVTRQLISQVTSGSEPDRRAAARQQMELLTEREHEVALAVGQGLSNAEIAADLHMSVPTVKAHIGRLFVKFGVENRVQVAIVVHDAN